MIFSSAANGCRLFFLPEDGFDVLLRLVTGRHDLMATAKAPQPEIRAGAQDLPLLLAAGMGLLHHENIIQLNIHDLILS